MAVLKYKKKDGSYATLTNISIKPIDPVQTTGNSLTDIMSQNAVTVELENKLAVSDFNTYSGTVDTAIGNKASQSDLSTLSGTVTSHTSNETIHVTSANKETWDAVTGKVDTNTYTAYTSTTDTAISGKLAKTDFDTYSGAVDTAISGKLSASDFNTYSGNVNTTIGNKVDKVEGKALSTNDFTTDYKNKLDSVASGANVNVNADWNAVSGDALILNKPTLGTAAAKSVSNGITNTDSLIESKHIYSGAGVTIEYDSGTKYIQLKSTSGNVLSSFDATAFIKDGMVSNVEIKNGNLVITFNSDSGKEAISIPLTSIFNPSNYYTTAQTSGASEISTALAAKTDTATTTALNNVVTGHTANTSIHLSSTEKTNLDSLETNIAAISGITSTKVGNWDEAATNSHTHSNKSVLDGISSSDITNWNGKTSNVGTVTNVKLSLPTGLSASTTAITSSGTFDIALSNGYSIPTTTKQGQWDTAYTNNHTHSNKSALDSITGSVGSMAYENTSSYSSATEVNTALSGKVDKVDGKGLSTNDYTTAEKNKLSGIAAGAQVNVQSDWNATSGDAFIKNKPTIPAEVTESTVSSWGFTKNTGTITGIKMNGFSKGTSGVVDLGTVITAHQDISGKVDKTTTVNGHALSGNVTVTKSDVGLGNVDNTADANKTVKAATSAATADTAKAVALTNVTGADDIKAIEALTSTSGLLKKTAANTWTLDTTSYSSATQVNTALGGKSNTGHTHDDRYYTESELTGSSTSVVVAKASSATTAASAGSVAWGDVSGKPSTFAPSSHNQASNTINSMAGYSKPTTTSGIATGDTLNAAIGKLEKALDGKQPSGSYLTSHQTVTLASGTDNGTLKITTAAGTADNIAVKGLGGAAYLETGTTAGTVAAGNHTHDYSNVYQAKGDYAAAEHTHAASAITNFASAVENIVSSSTTIETRVEAIVASAVTDNASVSGAINSAVESNSAVTASKAVADFYSGHNTVSTLANIPTDKRLVIATIDGSTNELSLSGNALTDGYEIHVIVTNGGEEVATVTLPSSGGYISVGDTISIEAGVTGEINIISDGTNKYVRGV